MAADADIEKTAILLITLGADHASEVLKHLGPKEVQKLGHAMAALHSVPRTKVAEIIAEFQQKAAESAAVNIDTDAYVRSVMTKALGDDKGCVPTILLKVDAGRIYLLREAVVGRRAA